MPESGMALFDPLRTLKLELPVAGFEVGRLAQRRPAGLDPFRRPANQLLNAHARVTEEAVAELAIVEERVGRLGADEIRLLANDRAELLAHAADAQKLRARDVQNERRRRNMVERLDRHGIRVGLPDDVDI